MKKVLEEIFARELARIDEASKKGPLDMDDLKKVEILTRSLKQIETPIKLDETLEDLTKEQLLILANLSKKELYEYTRSETKPDSENEGGDLINREESEDGVMETRDP